MTKRLQVLLEDEELRDIQALAKRRRQTTAAFVRDALRAARTAAEYPLPEARLRAVREAAGHAYPAGDIEELLAQTEQGYLSGEGGPATEPTTS
jgi:Ribbon-helix-helix protein, copG family